MNFKKTTNYVPYDDVSVISQDIELICFDSSDDIYNDKEIETLIPLEVKEIYKSKETKEYIKKLEGYYEYKITGILVGKYVNSLGFKIEIEQNIIPNDIESGDYITIIVPRIDVIWRN